MFEEVFQFKDKLLWILNFILKVRVFFKILCHYLKSSKFLNSKIFIDDYERMIFKRKEIFRRFEFEVEPKLL